MEPLDCKGLACPQPVLRTKQAIEENPEQKEFKVLVDNSASAQNVLRFFESQGFSASLQSAGEDFEVTGVRSDEVPAAPAEQQRARAGEKTLIVVTSNKMGAGDDTLGAGLMLNFLNTIHELGKALWRLVFLNSGVKLTIDGAETLPTLQHLEAQGVSILVCGTCLNHFNLLERKQVGETTNMLDIVTSLQLADKAIVI
ncbi:MAG: sulfurtransferase-like selenium metabolism protein YedF [Deltaproteobacteria bacterium]|nr:sulfurtransferase-like selenium metabolism protein YedF [Deltaproteobacteria bacterium]